MNCFRHLDRSAVGVCKSCGKGVCADCAVEVEGGLACRNACEEKVRAQAAQPLSPMTKLLIWLSPWPFMLGGVIALSFGGYNLLRAQQSLSWPTTSGIVRDSAVDCRSSNEGTTYHARVRYEYSVNGTKLSGDSVAYGDYGSSDSSDAQSIVNRYPVGQNVSVYYRPASPKESLLEPGVKGQIWLLPGIGLFLLIDGIVMLVFLPRLLKMTTRRGTWLFGGS